MSFTTILKTGEGLLLKFYKGITDKFKRILTKAKQWFPVLNRYPLLMYGLIPLFIGLFFLLRYIIKFLVNEFAAWASAYLDETSAFSISEGTIMLAFVAGFIVLRILTLVLKQKNKKTNTKLIEDKS